MWPEPVIPPLVRRLELLDDVLDVDPTVDVHLKIELFGSVSEYQGQSSTQTVPLTGPHDEFTLRIACWAQVVICVVTVVGTLSNHRITSSRVMPFMNLSVDFPRRLMWSIVIRERFVVWM